jgi:hypothetical protein
MATNNNWLKTNIRERLTNPEIDFKVFFDPQPYEDMSFDHATKSVAHMIAEKYPKLFIAYSGGMDSEFVFHLFRKLKIEFTPIIVSSTSNTLETAYAFHECRKHDIKPIVVEKTDNEILKIFHDDIFLKLNGCGYDSTPMLIAGRCAEENNGVVIIADHAYDGLHEWDFYNDVLIHPENSVYFGTYTYQLAKTMMVEYKGEDHQEFKHRLYDIPFRPKIKYHHSEEFFKTLYSFKRKIYPGTSVTIF